MTGFDQIYTEYFHIVFLYMCKLTHGNERLAEEITSEAFFKALRTVDGFRGDCDIRVWLCQIAKNCYYTHCRKKHVDVSLDEIEDSIPDPTGPTLEALFVRHEEAAQIRKVLHTLDPPYKEVFMWRVFGELSFKQIGDLFQKNENWACVTFHRARSAILKRMEGDTHAK